MRAIFVDEGHLIDTAELHFAKFSRHDHRKDVKVMKFNRYLLKLGTALLLFAVDTACSRASADEPVSDESQGGAGASGDAGNSSTATVLTVNVKTTKNSMISAERGTSPIPTANQEVRSTAASYIAGFSLSADTPKGFTTSTQVTSNAYATEYAMPTPSSRISIVGDMRHSPNYRDNAWPNNFQPNHGRPEARFVANCSNSVWPSDFQPDHDCQ
jgi:hypothetical protein